MYSAGRAHTQCVKFCIMLKLKTQWEFYLEQCSIVYRQIREIYFGYE